MNGFLSSGFPPSSLIIIFVSFESRNTKGEKSVERIFIIGATNKANFSGYCIARFFGVISPNIRINIVIIIVASPTPPFPKNEIASIVATADAAVLTALFPKRIAPSILFGVLSILSIVDAFLTFDSTMCLSLILLRDISEVSEAEKKPETIISTTSSIN